MTAVAFAAAGIVLTQRPRFTSWLVRVSGVLLVAAAIFGVIPELISDIGVIRVVPLAVAGFAILGLVDRYVAPVCPTGDYQWHAGYLTPLLAATAIHSFVDGWGLVAVSLAETAGANAIFAAIFLHKVPEGLILGGLVGGFVRNRTAAASLCLLAESATLIGGATGLWMTPAAWVSWPLALAAGSFVYLGIQAIRPGHHAH